MEYVTSADGTRIAYDRGGDGPPLVLVHGTASDHTAWSAVLPALREHFTVYAIDRRGRGESGDADDYAIEREFEDVAALVSAVDGPMNLLGHSYGAVCSIGAVPLLDELDRLVLYEPPLWTEERGSFPAEVLERMESLAERGENEEVLRTFFEDVTGSPERLEALRSQPDYERRLVAAEKLPREIRGRLGFRPDPEDYADVTVPTRFLLGTETSDPIVRSTEAARELFRDSEVVELEGQGHAAMSTAPDLLVSRVVEFLAAGA